LITHEKITQYVHVFLNLQRVGLHSCRLARRPYLGVSSNEEGDWLHGGEVAATVCGRLIPYRVLGGLITRRRSSTNAAVPRQNRTLSKKPRDDFRLGVRCPRK